MDKYDDWQFKKMRKRYRKDTKINTWTKLYTEMRKDLEELKKQNKMQDERIRVMAILKCAEQKKDNIELDKAVPLVSLVYSIIATVISLFSKKDTETIVFLSMVLIVSALLIIVVCVICWKYCKRRRNDIVYYQTKLNIIDMLLAEDMEK